MIKSLPGRGKPTEKLLLPGQSVLAGYVWIAGSNTTMKFHLVTNRSKECFSYDCCFRRK